MTNVAASRGFASDPLWRQAQACLTHGRLDAAGAVLDLLRKRDAGGAHAHLLAAQIAWREDRIRDGARHALEAARAEPGDPETVCAIVGVLLETGESVAARDCLSRPGLAECRDPVLLMRLAAARKRLEQHAEALALLDRARESGHATPALKFRRGEALLVNGRLDEAEAELAASLDEAPAYGRVAVPLVRVRKQTSERNHLPALRRSLQQVKRGTIDHAALEFARYKALEDLGRDTEAWDALAHANRLMRARLGERASGYHAWLERFLARTTPERAPSARAMPSPSPIFIIGVARSGTTLLERMLGNHSRVAVAGELLDFGAQLHWVADTRDGERLVARVDDLDHPELGRRYLAQTQWRAGGKRFYIDKQPPNWMLAGAIHMALPHAPILNLVRDPMDTCFSNWRAYFGDNCDYSYELGSLAGYFNDYRRVMAHWHRIMPGAILDVPYAGLVREPEATLREVFAFCGLEWEPDCADITRNAAPSATLSAAQVRSPLHGRAFGEWRRYEQQLQPLRKALTRHG